MKQIAHVALNENNPTFIGPDGYCHFPAHPPRVSACVSSAPCVTMLYQIGAFDFLPMQP